MRGVRLWKKKPETSVITNEPAIHQEETITNISTERTVNLKKKYCVLNNTKSESLKYTKAPNLYNFEES